MGWQWHQLNHMQAICTSLHKITTPAPRQSDFYRPDALPDTNSIKALKAYNSMRKIDNPQADAEEEAEVGEQRHQSLSEPRRISDAAKNNITAYEEKKVTFYIYAQFNILRYSCLYCGTVYLIFY